MRRLAICALLLTACGGPDPRYGEASLSEGSPRVSQTGTTFGQAAAMELAPGCPGYLDAEQPGHVLHVEQDGAFTIQVRSEQGPVALAVAHADEVRCDSDEGSGHAPSLSFEGAGDYQVFVAALRAPAALAYELTAHTDAAGAGATGGGPTRDVSVTITSEPAGAEVTGVDGEVVGRTPAMFMLSVPAAELGQERTWRLALADHEPVTVSGQLGEGAMVLHGQLRALTPTEIDVTSDDSQPIQDYRSAALAVEVAEDCAITDAEIEVGVTHSFIGDLRVVLRTPWEEDMLLQRHQGGGRRNLSRSWDMDRLGDTVRGRSTRGRWTLIVYDDAGADTGTLDRFRLHLTCDPRAGQDEDEPESDPSPPPRNGVGASAAPSPSPTPRRPSLPSLPTRAEIVRVFGGLRPRAEACATHGGNVRVMATVRGSTGRVTSVSSSGTASSTERSCVERVVRTARFGRFSQDSVDVDYSYDLPVRTPTPTPTPGGGQVIEPFN